MTGKTERKGENGTRKARQRAIFWNRQLALGDFGQRSLLLVALSLLLTFVILPKGGFMPGYYRPGDVASRNVKAPRDLLVADQVLTEKKRQEAADAVLPLYDFDPRAGRDAAERLNQVLQQLRQGQRSDPDRAALENLLGVGLAAEDEEALRYLAHRPEVAARFSRLLQQAAQGQVVGNLQLFQTSGQRGIVIRDLTAQQERTLVDLDSVIGIHDAFDLLRQELAATDGLQVRHRQALLELARKLLRPSLSFNINETENRRQAAKEAVKPVLFQVKKGEMIIREGERVTEEQLAKLNAFRDLGGDLGVLRLAAGLTLAMLLLVFTGHRFAVRNISKYRTRMRDLLFLASACFTLFVLVKLAIFMCNALEGAFPYIDSTSYYYAIPFAAGAMLVRIALNSEVALLFSIVFAVAVGLLFGSNLPMTMYVLVGSLAAAHWVRHCCERNTLYQAGMWLSLANVLMVLAIQFLAGRPFDEQLFYKAGFAVAGGFISALLVTGLVPLIESLFKYTTNIKLLELANMNTPVLRELMIQAPGTYHHSIIVGNLAECAAETIGANPLLARVAAYYHDIGKIRKPLYFVENIGAQENRHDKLAPSMSALILMSHVKEGVDMAREHKLGQTLVDIIRQHHGTALIKFFYDKAKNQADPGVHQVDERDYRYPGPKPQTREAALIMLADAIEAASRTLTDPTPARIQGMVQKIINNIFIDGQLDECELTLKDLHNIAKSFNRILAGIFHHRIDYPEPVYKERAGDKRKNGDDSHREPAREPKDRDGGSGKGGTDDLKRLGMS